MTNITICIATCKRPEMLGKLLESLSLQTVLKNKNVYVELVVVDNDPLASAKSVVTYWAGQNYWPISYKIQKKRGIPFARNMLVSLSKDADFIAFIDDDETAHKRWLAELLVAQEKYSADVVAGPVLPKFPEQPPDWIVTGKFFVRPQYITGEPVKYVGTGNVLIRNSLLKKVKGPFEEKIGLQGGGDILLFCKLHQQYGAHMVWANDAIAEEHIPLSRVRVSWLLKRHYRNGLALGTTESYLAGPLSAWRLIRLTKGIAHITRGFFLIFPAVLRGKAAQVQTICFLALGVGSIASVLKLKYNEYQIIHGK